METTARQFPENARKALADAPLQKALGHIRTGFIQKRRQAADRLPEFEALRDRARDIRDGVLNNLDFWLERFERQVVANRGTVHWCHTDADARDAILSICRLVGAQTVTKGKTMIGEEIGINDYLAANGIVPVETDLGEYIIQLRGEPPSHIIAPAIHVNREQVASAFREAHTELDPGRPLDEPSELLAEARRMLRERFLAADVGITGANFLVAETGSAVIVTNEGNGDLTQTLPRIHIVLASLEKIVPTLEDAATLTRVLTRSATGQEATVYTTFATGPRRPGDPDGPEQFHVVLLDNGRSRMIGSEFQDVLRCIRCGACLNHCPVYAAVGGHAYGSVYPGPVGAVLTPWLAGIGKSGHLPNASTFCGRCEAVCPVRIPLPRLMRHWREREHNRSLLPGAMRTGLGLWTLLATQPWLYQFVLGLVSRTLAGWARGQGRLRRTPLARGWTDWRDLPAPPGTPFRVLWRMRQRRDDDG